MKNKIDARKFAVKLASSGDRVKYLRKFTELSRAEFSKEHNISESTIRSWEFDSSPISEKLMKRLLEGFAKEGIETSAEWITKETEEFALLIATHEVADSSTVTSAHFQKESDLFLEEGSRRILQEVCSVHNAPFLKEGDLVGGEICSPDNHSLILDNFCLTRTYHSKEWDVRLVKKSEEEGRYTLLYAKSSEDPIAHPIQYNVELAEIAPILWIRKA